MKIERYLKTGVVLSSFFIIPFLFACAGSGGGVATSRDHSVSSDESDEDDGVDPLAVFMGGESGSGSPMGDRPDGVEFLINQDLALHGVRPEEKELPRLRSTFESSDSSGWRPRKGYDIPMVYNKQVERWVRTFSGPLRSHFARWLKRASRYGPIIEDILAEYQLPYDLMYLAMIESGFNLNAYSHANAAGPWQFIRSTGKMYGLDAGAYVDERRDLEKATRAAAAHLRDLHNLYHDWYLAFAAYNAGAGGVNRAIRAGGTRDFWALSAPKKRYLHTETKDYVPRILAAAYISKNHKKFGFPSSLFESGLTRETVTVPDATDLSVIAECAGVSLEEVKELNPALIIGMTPPKERFTVNVPRGTADQFERNYARVPKDQRVRFVYHKVQKKETLTRIARRYGVSKSALAQANGFSAKLANVRAGTLLVIPKKGVLPKLKLQPEKEVEVAAVEQGPLVALNEVEKPTVLDVPEPAANLSPDLAPDLAPVAPVFAPEEGSGTTSGTAPKIASKTYKVKKGDTLGLIASRHGVSLASLRRLNGLGTKNVVKIGQVLKVIERSEEKIEEPRVAAVADSLGEGESAVAPVAVNQVFEAAPEPAVPAPTAMVPTVSEPLIAPPATPQEQIIVHRVRRGETLYGLAKKYGVTIAQLKNWNRLNDTRLYPNQKIKIYGQAPVATAKKVALLGY